MLTVVDVLGAVIVNLYVARVPAFDAVTERDAGTTSHPVGARSASEPAGLSRFAITSSATSFVAPGRKTPTSLRKFTDAAGITSIRRVVRPRAGSSTPWTGSSASSTR